MTAQTPAPSSARRRKLWGALILAALLLSAVGIGVAGFYVVGPGPLKEPVNVVLPKGIGIRGMSRSLAEAGVIRWPHAFAGMAVLMGKHKTLKAGEYAFDAAASSQAVLEKLARGEVVIRKFTVPEGLSVWEVAERLKQEAAMSGEVPSLPPEGSLLPETYHFVFGEDRAALLARMQDARAALLAELWEKRAENLPWRTPEEAVIIASIVEKETGHVEERGRVAGVFFNRLRIGMKLQSDPTVVYGLTLGKGPLGRDLTRADLERDTPYNTYTRSGLPPSPIANPGRASLEAVLRPEATRDLYFGATGDGDGRHLFAPSLEEHNRNVAIYRSRLKR